MRLPAGTQLGAYVIRTLIREDETELVYRARYTHLDSDVALKIAQSPIGSDHFMRFLQQWRTGALIGHPNVLAVYDFGWHEGRPFVVSELVQGETLRARLAGGPLPPAAVAAFGIQIADGLAAAHRAGVVHRELKPANILVTRGNRVKILNFGRAASLEETLELVQQDSAASDTREILVEALAYMSPEQASATAVDHRADIFSLGVLLYEMAAGVGPFRRNSPIDTLRAILEEAPPDLRRGHPALPPELHRIIRRCLEKDPDERFHSARDVCFNLELLMPALSAGPRTRASADLMPGSLVAHLHPGEFGSSGQAGRRQ
jgi:serine/threonine protein kinase